MGEQALNIERPGNKNKSPPRGFHNHGGAHIVIHNHLTIMGGGISMTAGGSIMGLQVITLSPPFFLTWHLAHLVYFAYLAHLVNIYLVYLVHLYLVYLVDLIHLVVGAMMVYLVPGAMMVGIPGDPALGINNLPFHLITAPG